MNFSSFNGETITYLACAWLIDIIFYVYFIVLEYLGGSLRHFEIANSK
jgi:hypothetical protein